MKISDTIDKVLQNIKKYDPSKIKFSIPGERTITTDQEWIWSAYQSIEELTVIDSRNYPTLLEFVYYLTDAASSHCTGQIFYKGEQGELYTNILGNFYINDYNKMTKLSHEIEKRVRANRCYFTSIYFGIYGYDWGHQNLILLIYDKKLNKIRVAVYDPHGSYVDKKIQDVSNKFVDALVQVNSSFMKINRTDLSPKLGMQIYSCERVGFCIMYSLLWLYCVISVTKTFNNRITINQIKYIDEYLIWKIMETDGMESTMLQFSTFIILKYIENLQPKSLRHLHIFINKKMPKTIKEIMTEKPKFKKAKKKLTKKQRNRLERLAMEETIRKINGSECESDNDCMSDHCVDGICQDYDYGDYL